MFRPYNPVAALKRYKPVKRVSKLAKKAFKRKVYGRYKPRYQPYIKQWVRGLARNYNNEMGRIKNLQKGDRQLAVAKYKYHLPLIREDTMAAIRRNMNPVVNYLDTSSGVMTTASFNSAEYYVFELGNAIDMLSIADKLGINNEYGKFDLTASELRLEITNQRQTMAKIKVYTYHTRRDMPHSLGGTQAVLRNGFTDAAATQINHNTPYSTPYQNPQFVQYCQIDSQKTYDIMPGRELDIILDDARPRTVSMIILDNSDLSSIMGTKGIIVHVQGQALNDRDTSANVGLDQFKLDYVVNTKYSARVLVEDATKNYLTNALVTPTNANAVNVYTGAIGAPANA